MASGNIYIGSELHPDGINNIDCKDEVLALLSHEVRDLRGRIFKLERLMALAMPGLNSKRPVVEAERLQE